MLDQESVINIHRQLQAVYLHGDVLLCGSYLSGEAGEDSDLDFTLLTDNFRYFNFYRRHKELISQIKLQNPKISLAIWPRWYCALGWHYVYGRNLAGKIFTSPLRKKFVICTGLKLAFFYWLKFSVTKNAKYLIQSARQIAAVQVVANLAAHDLGLDFSRKFINDHTHLLMPQSTDVLIRIINSPPDYAPGSGDSYSVLQIIQDTYRQLRSYFSFSPANYLLYNFKFLMRGSIEFVFRNPDKYLINIIAGATQADQKERERIYQHLNIVIFPIIVI